VWLLILAIVILILSAFQMSYYVAGSQQPVLNRPRIFYRHEGFLICSNTVFLIAGFVMLFIAAGWRWGLGGLAIYWVLVSFVLRPIVNRVIGGDLYGQHIFSLSLDEFAIGADDMRALILPTLPLEQALISLKQESAAREQNPGDFIMVGKKGLLFPRKWIARYYSSKNPDDALELVIAEGDYHPIASLLKKHDTEAAREAIKAEILRQVRGRGQSHRPIPNHSLL